MSSQAAPRVGYRQAVASRQFRALFASQLVSISGTSIAAVALTIVVYQRTASPLLASLTFALGFLPYLLGERAPVKSHHHQGFGRIGEGLRVAAHAEDGTIEAVEDPSRRFALGVLWHPEAGEDLRLFEELVRAAR